MPRSSIVLIISFFAILSIGKAQPLAFEYCESNNVIGSLTRTKINDSSWVDHTDWNQDRFEKRVDTFKLANGEWFQLWKGQYYLFFLPLAFNNRTSTKYYRPHDSQWEFNFSHFELKPVRLLQIEGNPLILYEFDMIRIDGNYSTVVQKLYFNPAWGIVRERRWIDYDVKLCQVIKKDGQNVEFKIWDWDLIDRL